MEAPPPEAGRAAPTTGSTETAVTATGDTDGTVTPKDVIEGPVPATGAIEGTVGATGAIEGTVGATEAIEGTVDATGGGEGVVPAKGAIDGVGVTIGREGITGFTRGSGNGRVTGGVASTRTGTFACGWDTCAPGKGLVLGSTEDAAGRLGSTMVRATRGPPPEGR